jgi:hypothetical protein
MQLQIFHLTISNFTLRCMEHSLHLAAKHFVKSLHHFPARIVTPQELTPAILLQMLTLMMTTMKTLTLVIHLGKRLPWSSRYEFCRYTKTFSVLTPALEIHKSPQARSFFRATCSQVGITPLELLLWIRTCWGSLFKFLECFLLLKAVRNLSFTSVTPLTP